MTSFKFMMSRFNSMPKWVQIIVYLTICLLYTHEVIKSNYIYGRTMIYSSEFGGDFPFRGSLVELNFQGHIMKFTANEDGAWVVPLTNAFLWEPVKLRFYKENNLVSKEITLYPQDFMFGSVNITYNPDDFDYPFLVDNFSIISEVLANPYQKNRYNLRDIFQDIVDQVNYQEFYYQGSLEEHRITGVNFIILKSLLEGHFNIRVSDEEWKTSKTIKDVVILIQQKIMDIN